MKMLSDEDERVRLPIAASEVRQWTFCPRVIWHRRVMPHRVRETPKMELGRNAQTALERLEKRRLGARYKLVGAQRHFNVRLESDRLAVRGFCDLVLELPETPTNPRQAYPVEVKRTRGGASAHHRVQLAGYAILLEESWGLPPNSIDQAFVLLLPDDIIVPVPITLELRDQFEQSVQDLREMLRTERFPNPTKHRSFCPQCEYVRFCGDVL